MTRVEMPELPQDAERVLFEALTGVEYNTDTSVSEQALESLASDLAALAKSYLYRNHAECPMVLDFEQELTRLAIRARATHQLAALIDDQRYLRQEAGE